MKKYKTKLLRTQTRGFYLGLKVPKKDVQIYLKQLKDILGSQKFGKVTLNQKTRDHNSFHITILTLQELRDVDQVKYIELMKKSLKCKLVGLGKAVSNNNSSFFVVVDSRECDEIRESLGLAKRDFHITLGFTEKDIHNKSKNISSLIQNN